MGRLDRLQSRGLLFAQTLLMLAASCGEVRAVAPKEQPEPPLNVVLVTIDTLRRDHLGCYGYFRNTSPNLDALARESLVFDDLQSHVSQTLPSHTSLFTGLAPGEHGIESNISWLKGSYIPSPKIRLLASVLQEQGYETAGMVSATPLKEGSGVEVGFETWVQPEKVNVQGDVTVDAALAWLEEAPAEPWFLWVHLFDPHHPYLAPAKFRRFEHSAEQAAHLAALGIPERITTKAQGQVSIGSVHDLYDAEVLFADYQLRRLLAGVREVGAWEQTAVVVTSDHGEGLWQHGAPDHSTIWNEQLEVPLIVRVPGVEPRRVESRMVGRDVLPTLLALLPGIDGAELLAQTSGVDVLAPDFEALPRYTIVPPMPLLRDKKERPFLYEHAIEHAGWRLVVGEGGHVELYDLEADPHELSDLAAAEPERAAKMKALLEREQAKELARRDQLEAGQLGPMSEERLQALHALGYGGGADDH